MKIGKVADIGNALQLFHNQSGNSVEVGIFFLRREVQLRREFDIFKRTVHSQTFIGIFLDSGFFLAFKLFGKFACDGFQQVFHGNHAQNRAEFIDHQSIIRAALAEQFNRA